MKLSKIFALITMTSILTTSFSTAFADTNCLSAYNNKLIELRKLEDQRVLEEGLAMGGIVAGVVGAIGGAIVNKDSNDKNIQTLVAIGGGISAIVAISSFFVEENVTARNLQNVRYEIEKYLDVVAVYNYISIGRYKQSADDIELHDSIVLNDYFGYRGSKYYTAEQSHKIKKHALEAIFSAMTDGMELGSFCADGKVQSLEQIRIPVMTKISQDLLNPSFFEN